MERLAALKRLSAVYSLIEEIHSIEARVSSAETSVVENAIGAEAKAEMQARAAERDAVEQEDRLGRSAMSAKEEMATRRRIQLEPIFNEKKNLSEAAHTRYLGSRLWSERMQSLVDAEKRYETSVEERRLQTDSDDRFLARRRNRERVDRGEMKIS